MSASETQALRRPRPPVIATLRILFPVIAAAVTLTVVVSAASGMLRTAEKKTAADQPIELVGPRMVGQDNKKRGFVITAASAERIEGSARISLRNPVLVRDPGGADQVRVAARTGVYDQGAGKLELAGDVKMSGTAGDFATPAAVYDAKTGEVVGRGAVQAAGGVGQLQAGSFAVKDKGASVVYKGGVHTRLNVK